MSKNYNEIEVKDNMKVVNKEEEPTVKKEKDLTQVVSAVPKKHKQGLLGRIISGVVGPDGAPSIGAYVNEEIIKPAIKNIVVDAVTSGINMIMYGEKSPNRGGNQYGGYQSSNRTTYRPNTNYSNNYGSSRHSEHERKIAKTPKYGVEEYLIEDRFDAAHVISTLTENADMYDSVSVADYYDLIGVASVYTDNTYGWTIDSILAATIVPVRGGYIIKFPPVEVI